MPRFDVVVVGGGHAGCEAAAAAARMGRSTAMVTFRLDHIGRLSCNPAIGGLAKGHLVYELDALGGLMPRIADAACIQFRRLNTRRGLAVRSSRAQVDIHVYPRKMREALAAIPGLTLIEGEVAAIRTAGERVSGVVLGDGTVLEAERVVLTTGTFLSGIMHRGFDQEVGGRIGDPSAHRLSGSLKALGLRLGRLKTGTVPRVDAATVAWDRVPVQDDTDPSGRFSKVPAGERLPQVDCHLTHTNEAVHALIRSGLDRSPLYTGVIQGTGPRYCPSIEDKVVRFADKERHLIFLEPEGLETNRVYVNGLSTSLPQDIQERMVHGVVGLENATILQFGYAVEYDFADPTDLDHGLQHKGIGGLYLAGQVNGTSGYEEAAAQGFVAGVSAATGEPFHVERSEAYLGVLVDDLVTRGVGGEPYRMFTSRAEHRLLLREDNADRRLIAKGRALGLVDPAVVAAWEQKEEEISSAGEHLGRYVGPGTEGDTRLQAAGLAPLRKGQSVAELLRRPEVSWATLQEALGLPLISDEAAEQVEIDAKYAGYVARAERRADEARRMENVVLPPEMDWRGIPSLSREVRERIVSARPLSLGALARLPGVTPAAVNVVAGWLARRGAATAGADPG